MKRTGVLALAAATVVVAVAACGEDPPETGGGARVEDADFAHRAGEVAMARLGCTHCHQASPAALQRLRPLAAPDLTAIGARATAGWLRAFLADPHATVPGTRMPDALHGLPPGEKEAAVEDLVHFLVAQGGPFAVEAARAGEWRIEEGERLFRDLGCLPCHRDGLADRGLARKTDLPKLARFLRDPHAARPSGVMPALALDAGEARSIGAWLLREQHAQGPAGTVLGPGVDLRYYVVDALPETLADFDGATPEREGHAESIGLHPPHRDDQFAFEFEGYLRVPESGYHELYLESDDGSQLWIDGETVVDNDGLHGPELRTGTVELEAGAHPFRIFMFEASGGASLEAGWMTEEGPRPFAPADLRHRRERYDPIGFQSLDPDPARVERGRRRFLARGCVQCHQRVAEPATAGAPPLAQLGDPGGGCLAAPPPAGAPRYALDETSREGLRAVVESAAALEHPLPPEAEVAHAFDRLQCVACHERAGVGGPLEEQRSQFRGQGDLGDEGRVPPDLSDAGGRLREEWLRAVLLGDARVRPYLHTRMPSYRAQAVEFLPAALAAADEGAHPPWSPGFDAAMLDAGRRLVGTGGFACIGCHGVSGQPSLGVPGPDLATTWERLRPGYFRAWLADPVALRPGTRMPAFFAGGTSTIADVLGGDPEAQIAAIWNYLSLGEAMPLPEGLVVDREEYELVPVERPIYCGVFMRGLSAEVLCVGFPQKVHAAFDMHAVRLALLWRGDFLNAEGTWQGRAGQLEEPAGTDVLALPPGPAVAVLGAGASHEPWPQDARARAWRWRGHERSPEGHPTFLYRLPGADPSAPPRVEVEETLRPVLVEGGARLQRTFRVRAGVAAGVVIRLAWSEGAPEQGVDGALQLDQGLRLRGRAMDAARVVRALDEGPYQILVDVPADGAWHEFPVEMDW